MAVLEILKFPDPRLRKKCTPITTVTPDLQTLADNMLHTMRATSGLGLSAIQVGVFVRLFIADTRPLLQGDNKRYEQSSPGEYEKTVQQPVILFNPEITKATGHTTFLEGCLSFPSYYAEVKRSSLIEVEGLDLSGQKRHIKTDGVLAICMQHEIDHLNGKLFIDHLSPVKAQALKAQIKKHGYPQPESQTTAS